MPLLQISQLGHPILRQKARAVAQVSNPEIQTLIDDMIQTCADASGLGIAAPQVYQPLRLFILSSKPTPRYPTASSMAPMAMVNPTITERSEETEKDWEGCLSIPGLVGLVTRHKSVTVSFTNRFGEKADLFLEGLAARVFQHEYDHLDGIVFLDRADTKELYTDKEYQRKVREAAD